MKTQILSVLAAAAVLFSAAPQAASAQEALAASQVTVQEEFNPHFYILPQVGASYTSGETSFGKLISPAAALNLGYRFSPVFGLRIGGSGWQGKGSWVNPRHDYKWNYLQGNVDAVLSFTNLFMSYNPDRVLDLYGFIGGGVAVGFHNNDVQDLIASGIHFEKAWNGKRWFGAGRFGIGLDVNLSRAIALNFEVNANMLNDHFNSKRGSKIDWQTNALVGLKISFGSTRTVAQAVEEVVVEEPAPAPAPEPEPAPAPAPAPVVEKPAPVQFSTDIFFRINSSRIMASEQSKVDSLVNFMKENPTAKVTITGYADKNTGSSAYNLKISRFRAERVADALKKAGIAPSRITIDAKGDSVQPFAENNKNRVAIGVAIAE